MQRFPHELVGKGKSLNGILKKVHCSINAILSSSFPYTFIPPSLYMLYFYLDI